MERLTIEKAGSILVNDLSGGYTSPCFGCESLGNCVSKKIQPCAIYRALEKLKKYEDLSEQGKLLKLPCAVGDTVYFPCEEFNFVFPVIISQIIISDSGEGRFCVQYNGCFFDGFGDPEKDFEFDMEDFGKTVFLTKSAAEVALQKLKETEG